MKTEDVLLYLVLGFVGYKIVTSLSGNGTTITIPTSSSAPHVCPPGEYWMTNFAGGGGQCAPVGTVT